MTISLSPSSRTRQFTRVLGCSSDSVLSFCSRLFICIFTTTVMLLESHEVNNPTQTTTLSSIFSNTTGSELKGAWSLCLVDGDGAEVSLLKSTSSSRRELPIWWSEAAG